MRGGHRLPTTDYQIDSVKKERNMKSEIRNLEGIVLRGVKGAGGGRMLSIFTKEMGLFHFSLSPAAMKRYGTGALLPLSHLRFSASLSPDYGCMSQYEGEPLVDTLKLPFEDLNAWYYVIELLLSLFPVGEADPFAYQVLGLGALSSRERNPKVCAFAVAVELLAAAGFDPTEEEPEKALGISEKGRELLSRFRDYDWQGPFGASITAGTFNECARYIDQFMISYCDLKMKTAGAFL